MTVYNTAVKSIIHELIMNNTFDSELFYNLNFELTLQAKFVQRQDKMYTIEVHNRIEQIMSLFYFLGLWHGDDRDNVRKWSLKIIHLLTYGYFPLSLVAGALTDDNETVYFQELHQQ